MLRKWVIALAAINAVYSGSALAVGLGQVSLHSALNQTLNATIDLVTEKPLKPDQVIPTLGSVKDFKRAGVERPDYLNSLRFKAIESNGSLQIQVSSDTPINEPFVSFLLEVRWPKGRLLREYTVLLDPPAFGTRNIDIAATKKVTPQPTVLQTYTVKNNDSLWDIARQFTPNKTFTVEQVVKALQKMNPHALMDGNPNKLKKSVTLNIPTEEEVLALSGGKPLRVSIASSAVAPAEEAASQKKDQLRKLTTENVKLVRQLKQLETQIGMLETIVSDKKSLETKSEETGADPTKQMSGETVNVSNIAVVTKPGIPLNKNHASLPQPVKEVVVKPVTKPDESPAALSNNEVKTATPVSGERLPEKTAWHDALMGNLYNITLGVGGGLLLGALGWLMIKRRKRRQEEEAMDAILAAEAIEDEEKEAKVHAKDRPLKTEPTEDNALTFSELVTAREENTAKLNSDKPHHSIEIADVPGAKAEIEAKVDTETQERKEPPKDTELSESAGAEEIDALLLEEESALSLNMDETDVFSEEQQENSEFDQKALNIDDVQSASLSKTDELSSTDSGVPDGVDSTEVEVNSVEVGHSNDNDIASQLEQLDEELNALSEDLSFTENEEGAQASEDSEAIGDNESMASLLDLARAYLEMEDNAEARDILNKVVSQGDVSQQAEAAELLKRC